MRYIKKYNEDIEWEFDEEEIKLSDKVFYIYLLEYDDEYSYDKIQPNHGSFYFSKYRVFLGYFEEPNNHYLINNIINNKIYYLVTGFFTKQFDFDSKRNGVYNKIKNKNVWITNPKIIRSSEFRKWNFSELEPLLNINKKFYYFK